MEKKVISEINRMKEIMGHSLIVEQEGQIAKFIERLFTVGGDDAITTIVKVADQDVYDAISILNKKKNNPRRVTKTQLDNAYRTLTNELDPSKLVDNLVTKNLIPQDMIDGINKIKDAATSGQISINQYEKLIDDYFEKSLIGVDEEIRKSFKEKFKKQIPQGIKTVETLTKDVIEQMKITSPELFEMKWFNSVQKYPEKIKSLEKQIKDGWMNSGMSKDKIIEQVKKSGDDMVNSIKKSKLNTDDKNKIIEWWTKKTIGGKVTTVLTTAVIITLISNYIKTGEFWSAVGATGREIIQKTGEGVAQSPSKDFETKSTDTLNIDNTKQKNPIKTKPTLEL